jgi:hypothetical protein
MRKNAKKFINLVCKSCGKPFIKELKEYTRRLKHQRECAYCSLPCFNKLEKTDELSPFRCIFRNAKSGAKKRGLEFRLTVQFLKELFEKQKGRCAYTNISFSELRPSPHHYGKGFPESLIQASLDRINPNKGYTEDNVELVCLGINYAKSDFSKEEFLDFIKKIKENI